MSVTGQLPAPVTQTIPFPSTKTPTSPAEHATLVVVVLVGLGFVFCNLRPVIPPELPAVVVVVDSPLPRTPLPLASWLPLNSLLPPASGLICGTAHAVGHTTRNKSHV